MDVVLSPDLKVRPAYRSAGLQACPPPPLSLERVENGLRDVARAGLAAEIGRPGPASGEHLLDGADDEIVARARAEMIEHQRARPDRADRIGDALALDVRRRPVDRLEHRRML